MLPPTHSLIVREGDRPMMVPHQVTKPRFMKAKPKVAQTVHMTSAMIVPQDEDEFDDTEVSDEENAGSSFFSFYDQKKEEEKLKLIAPTSGISTKVAAPSLLPERAFDIPIDESVLPPLPVKPFADSELPEPSTAVASSSSMLDKDEESDDEGKIKEQPEPMWSESTFIPGPEVLRTGLVLHN